MLFEKDIVELNFFKFVELKLFITRTKLHILFNCIWLLLHLRKKSFYWSLQMNPQFIIIFHWRHSLFLNRGSKLAGDWDYKINFSFYLHNEGLLIGDSHSLLSSLFFLLSREILKNFSLLSRLYSVWCIVLMTFRKMLFFVANSSNLSTVWVL